MAGKIIALHFGPSSDEPLSHHDEATLVAGKGVVGDRNYNDDGAIDEEQFTLIESENVTHFVETTGLNIASIDTRRNAVTEGIALNELVGKEFSIGNVRLKGIDLCHPCDYLSGLLATDVVSKTEVLKGLADRGGLRAEILSGGTVRLGDELFV